MIFFICFMFHYLRSDKGPRCCRCWCRMIFCKALMWLLLINLLMMDHVLLRHPVLHWWVRLLLHLLLVMDVVLVMLLCGLPVQMLLWMKLELLRKMVGVELRGCLRNHRGLLLGVMMIAVRCWVVLKRFLIENHIVWIFFDRLLENSSVMFEVSFFLYPCSSCWRRRGAFLIILIHFYVMSKLYLFIYRFQFKINSFNSVNLRYTLTCHFKDRQNEY